MTGDPKTNEWNLLKDQFDALVHDESVREDSIETFFDDQIRRRFGEWITRARERKNRTEMTPSRRRIAVGTRVTSRPPHKTVRAQFGHTAPTLGV